MSKFGNKMKKRSFLTDLKSAIGSMPSAARELAGEYKKLFKKKRKKKK
tara:strand:+ start:829 stop:972 length:144 start_codon:yes stop_codon:yes gene_type:complete